VKFSKDENFGTQEVEASIQWPSLCELLFSIVFGRTMDNRTNNNVESKYELKVPFCNQLNKTSA
jgi:hypothetical protein